MRTTTPVRTFETTLRAIVSLALITLFATASDAGEPARAFPEGDRLFHADPRWLGGDAAISVPLSATRTLWLFGDSFVDETAPYERRAAAFIHNTIAIEGGSDPRTAQMRFSWRRAGGLATPFFPDGRGYWYWPRGGVRLKAGPLILFLHKLKPAANALRFASAGYAIARIANADEDPARWRVAIIDQPAPPFDALPGCAAVIENDSISVLATRQEGAHAGAFVRYPLRAFARGNLSKAAWWLGETRGWVATARVGKSGPAFVIDDAGAESSLHWDARMRAFVHVASYGFGASTIGVRTAATLTGPWSAARVVFRPPESNGAQAFVYAGKAHPELTGAPGLLITYVANAFDPNALLTPTGERDLYWPHFVVFADPSSAAQ
jgi:hypothetical protein